MAFQPPQTSFATPSNFGNSASGRNAHLFRPPQSPASSTATPSFATATDYFSAGSRKRARPDSPHGADSRLLWTAATPSWVQCPTPSDGSYTGAGASGYAYGQNSALVNERYRLAGGFDTPSLQATAEMEQMHLSSTSDGRRWRGDAQKTNGLARSGTPLSGPLTRERNGVARMPSSYNGGDLEAKSSWTGLAFSLVGRVFSFGGNVIKGFYAGGGKGYNIKHSPLRTMWASQEGCSTPLPGSWQEDEFLGDFEQDNLQSPPPTASRPPNKRRQTDRDTWVMVGTPDLTETSPKRKGSSTSIPRSNLATRPTASRASSRRSLAPLPQRQSSHHTTQITHTGSPAQPLAPLSPDRRASFALMRSTNSRPNSSSSNHAANPSAAYISPEAERYVKRKAKQERQADAAMSDMSRKLADLIRQGQEALGTKFSVEGAADEGTDEGFVDEEW